MTMRVRFPNGQMIQYNNAQWLSREQSGWVLSEKKDGRIIAFIQPSAGAIVEWIEPCKVENPLLNVTGEKAIEYVLSHVEELAKTYSGRNLVKKLKKKLAGYSPRSGTWK